MASAKGLRRVHCQASLAQTARAILEVRMDELEETRATISGPADSEALHALRIVAKRLRYSLEMFAVCFPDERAQERADGVRAMQDVLGRIHDLDVLHDLLQRHITRIDAEAREEALRVATSPADGTRRDEDLLDRSRTDGKSDGRLGLYKVIAAKADERRQLYDRFAELWSQWEDAGFLTAMRGSLSSEHQVVGEAPKPT
jgi:CHAD domain